MKKIILLPKKDTVVLCLPEKWVGIPIICKLTPMYDCKNQADEYLFEKELKGVKRS